MKNKEFTVALIGMYFGWGGGTDFLGYVLNGLLAKQHSHNIKIYLLLPIANKIETPLDVLRSIYRSQKDTIKNKRICLALSKPDFHGSMLDFFSQTKGGKIEIIYHDSSINGLIRCLKRVNADIALPVFGTLGANSPTPWIGYIPDFQHKHLPNNFSSAECFEREISFASTLRDSRALIVNSKAVKNDICSFYPWINSDKIFNLPFAPHPINEWFEHYKVDINSLYNLPEKYFLISNQLWIHKDHLTALRALKLVAASYDISLVCTGDMNDYRHPSYLNELKQFIGENGLTERVMLLGHIPKRDQIEIMKKSLALIQPTLFEGGPGGGSVYDAISLGLPVILSEIPVNQEVNAENVHFFSAKNSDELATQMVKKIENPIIRPSQEKLMHMGQDNLLRLNDRLFEAINYTYGLN